MKYGQICAEVAKIKRLYRESDPFRLCKAMGLLLAFESLGTRPTAVKGFFIRKQRICMITINSDLPCSVQRIIAAHELGHAVLHKNSGISTFKDAALFNESSVLEKEANVFAAEFLMEDEEVIERLNDDGTFFSAARAMSVPMELLDFKFRVMKWKGFKLVEAPITSRSDFLKGLEVPVNYDDYVC